MTTEERDDVPRWKKDQEECWLTEVEAENTLVGQGGTTAVEDECIERLLKESEKRGLEQRTNWAKKHCVGSSLDRTLRTRLQRSGLHPTELCLEAKSAKLNTVGGEPNFSVRPLASSQCKKL